MEEREREIEREREKETERIQSYCFPATFQSSKKPLLPIIPPRPAPPPKLFPNPDPPAPAVIAGGMLDITFVPMLLTSSPLLMDD